MPIEIRLAEHGDLEQIADAHVAGWRVGYRGIFPDEYLDSEAFDNERRSGWRSANWVERPPTHVFVGVVDGRVVGFGVVGPERSDGDPTGRGELYSFYLHPDAWGTGVAMPLMQRCEQRLRDDGFTDAVLVVLRDNPRARRFYEKAGWADTGTVTMWDGPQMPGVAAPPQVADLMYSRVL